jgi:hypothetical protein
MKVAEYMSFERMTIRMPLNTCMFCLAEAQPNNDFLLIGNDVCNKTCEEHLERGRSRLCNFCGYQDIKQDVGIGYEWFSCKDCGAGYESTYNPEQAKLLGLETTPDVDVLYDDPRYAKCWTTQISNRRKRGWGELLSSR